jgi:glucosyl-3-phosphoglycerate synthase
LIRPFHHSQFPPELLRERKRDPITVVLPTREVADTIGPIVERLTALDLIDQVLVVDAASQDGTAEIAAALGADVHQEADLRPELGQVLGKGDAMWRALGVAEGELIVYLDSDTRGFSPHFATGMLGPLICHPDDVRFVKGHFRRPYASVEGEQRPIDGGRVTELTARPLLSAFYPELAAFVQPLAGEVAAPRSIFDQLPFATGYAIETSMLLHARDLLGGTDGMAQVDLEERHNHHQPLRALGPMAYAVLRVILERLRAEGRLVDDHAPPFQSADGQLIQVELIERPPYATLRARASDDSMRLHRSRRHASR